MMTMRSMRFCTDQHAELTCHVLRTGVSVLSEKASETAKSMCIFLESHSLIMLLMQSGERAGACELRA